MRKEWPIRLDWSKVIAHQQVRIHSTTSVSLIFKNIYILLFTLWNYYGQRQSQSSSRIDTRHKENNLNLFGLSILFYFNLCYGTDRNLLIFLGVSIIEGDAKGITMELEMECDGNPSIILDVKTRVGIGLPIQVLFNLFLISIKLFPSSKTITKLL